MTARDLLETCIFRTVGPEAGQWYANARDRIAAGSSKDLYLALGLIPRNLGKGELALDTDDLTRAEAARPGWDPSGWRIDQAARVALLLALAERNPEGFPDQLETLMTTADVGEQVAFYMGLPLYPHPERLIARASEGARSNMQALFEAVAHRNPFPVEQFSELAWNHMVLKALFVGSVLYPIQQLDTRANVEQARMLCDFAEERWSAGRDVSPEIWRCVSIAPDARVLEDLARALDKGEAGGARGAALALHAMGTEAARDVLARKAPELQRAIADGALTWNTVANELAQ